MSPAPKIPSPVIPKPPSSPSMRGASALLRSSRPDWEWILRVALRNVPLILAAGVVAGGVLALRARARPAAWISRVSVAYDARDAVDDARRDEARFRQIGARFSRLAAGDAEDLELAKIARAEGLDALEASSLSRRGVILGRKLLRLAPLDETAVAAGMSDTLRNELALRALAHRLLMTVDDASATVTLQATGETSSQAKALATQVMNAFVGRELSAEIARVEALRGTYAQLAAGTADAGASERATDDASASHLRIPRVEEDAPARADAPGVALRVESLRAREAELAYLIQQRRGTRAATTDASLQRRTELMTDLARLRATLQSSHPDVIAKEDELRSLNAESSSLREAAGVRLLLMELADVRAELREAGAPLRVVAVDSPGVSKLASELVARLALEKTGLEAQLQIPERRTRLRTTLAPTTPSSPTDAAGQGREAAVACGLVLLLVILREATSRRARDAWRIARRLGVPAFAVIPRNVTQSHPEITPEVVTRMQRAFAGSNGPESVAGRALIAYRDVVQSLRSHCEGRRILIAGVEGRGRPSKARSAEFLFGLFNVVAGETGEAVVVVDCDHLSPVSDEARSLARDTDTCTLLLGRSPWASVRIARTQGRAFDLVPAPIELTPAKARAFRPAPVRKLLEALERPYGSVFVRALSPRFSLENAALVDGATDVVLCIFARHAKLADLDAACANLGAGKLRGFILVDG